MAFDTLKKRHKSKKLKKLILNDRAKLNKFGPMLYQHKILEPQNELLVIPDNYISNTEEFDRILEILKEFSYTICNVHNNVSLTILNKSKDIIGYVVKNNDYIYDIYSLFKYKFEDVLVLLDFVKYLTENKISLTNLKYEHLTYDDFTNSFVFYYPHLLKIDENLNQIDNVRWFLGIVLHMLGIHDLESFKTNFYLSNEMYLLFEKVLFKDEYISLDELYDVFSNYIKSNVVCFNSKYSYDSNKYYTGYIHKNVNVSDEFLSNLKKDENILVRKEKYIVSRINTSDYFVIYTNFDNDVINSLKANAELLKITSFRVIDFNYFIYSREYSHPIGMCISGNNIKDILENRESLKDIILDKKSNVLIKIIDIIFHLIDNAYSSNVCFSKKLELNDFIYEFSNGEDNVCFGSIFDIIYPIKRVILMKNSKIGEEISKLKLDIALKVIKECTKYTINEGKVEFEPYSKVLSFSPRFKYLFKRYLLDENVIDLAVFLSDMLDTLYKNINNYKKHRRTYYYKEYPVNPFYTKMLMDYEIDSLETKDNTHQYIKLYNDKYVYNIFNYDVFIDKFKKLLNKLKNISSDIVIRDSYQIVYTEDKISDTILVNGIYVKKVDSIYKCSYKSIRRLYQKGIISNKDIIDLISEIMSVNKKINLTYLYFNKDLKLIILESDVLFSIGLQKELLFDLRYGNNDFYRNDLCNSLLKLIEVDSVFEANNLYDSLDTKCTHHNFWYNHADCCSFCYPNSIVIDTFLIDKVIRETNDYTEYFVTKNGKELSLKVLPDSIDKESQIKIYEQIYQKYTKYITKEKGDKVGGFFKRALDKDLNTIGFVTKFLSGSRKISSSYFDVKNRLSCICNLFYFLEKLYQYKFALKNDNFAKIIEFTEECQPLIIAPEVNIYENADKPIHKEESFIEFVKSVLLQCKVKGINEKYIERIINYLISSDFKGAIAKIKNAEDGLDSFCHKHKIYYSLKNHECCPECYNESIKGYTLEEVESSNLLSDIGKESVVYDLKGKFIGKVYRTDEDGNFENELDINKKQKEIKELTSKKDLLDYVNNDKNYELVLIEGVIIDKDGDFRGVITKKIENCKSIKILTDKAKIKEYNISRTDVFEILVSIGYAIEFCHNHGVYIGDLSYNNILFDIDTKRVYIIDFDSVNLKEGNNTVFTDHFVDPKAISKEGYAKCSKDADLYAFAILSFYLLTLLHPFNGVYFDEETNQKLTIPQRKVRKISVLGNHGVKIPPIALDWDFMTPELIKAFLDIFENDKRYNITKFLEDNLQKLTSLENFDYSAYTSLIENNQNDNKEEKVEKQDNNKKEVTDLITKFILRAVRSNEYIATKDVFVRNNNCIRFDVLNTIEIGTNIKKVYVCSSRMVYLVSESNQIGYCKKDHFNFLAGITTNSDIFPIPYTENMIYVSKDSQNLILYNASDDSYFHIYSTDTNPIPKFSLSINTRYGNNDVDMIMASFAEVIKLLCRIQADIIPGNNNYIYADLLGGYKYLIITLDSAKDVSRCYVYDYNDTYKSIGNIPNSLLSKINLKCVIFVNNAIYYPQKGKICSLNLFNKNYLEFICDKVNENSKIEVINGGFRINNGNEMFELIKSK